jgi:hypothetical protein
MFMRVSTLLRRIPKPSPALLIGLLALGVASTGTAVAATGQVVNIADGTDASHVAKVDAAGRLVVGDGSGALSVDGTVSARPYLPAKPWTKLQTSPGVLRAYQTTSISLTSLTLSNNDSVRADFLLYRDYRCTSGSGGSNLLLRVFVPAGTTAHVPLPAPLVATGVGTGCPEVQLTATWSSTSLYVTGVGFDG